MILSQTDKREVCQLHGWVGRAAFQRDRHDLCEAESSPFMEEEDDHDEDDDAENQDEVDEVDDESPRPQARRGGVPPKKTVAVRRITRLSLAAGQAELRELGADAPYERPKTRGDCARVPRPCPFVACKYSLYLDTSETGSIIFNFPHLAPWEMQADQSCALDLADRGGMTLEEIATVTNLSRERIRQVESKTLLRRARPVAIALGLDAVDAGLAGSRRQVGPSADLAETGVEGELPSDVATLLLSGPTGPSGKRG
jgi:hypothetical protein